MQRISLERFATSCVVLFLVFAFSVLCAFVYSTTDDQGHGLRTGIPGLSTCESTGSHGANVLPANVRQVERTEPRGLLKCHSTKRQVRDSTHRTTTVSTKMTFRQALALWNSSENVKRGVLRVQLENRTDRHGPVRLRQVNDTTFAIRHAHQDVLLIHRDGRCTVLVSGGDLTNATQNIIKRYS